MVLLAFGVLFCIMGSGEGVTSFRNDTLVWKRFAFKRR